MLIIPAIDLRAGKCVRLIQGDYAQETVYSDDPLETARSFVQQGAAWIHVVDLDGAKVGSPQNLGVVERMANECSAKIEFGGGVRDLDIAKSVLRTGVARVIIGSRLLGDRFKVEEIFREFGNQAVAGIDARNRRISVSGWTQDSDIDVLDLAKDMEALGAKRFIVTDIATDGMLAGPNASLMQEFAEALNSPVIASGGVSCLEDLKALAAIGGNLEGAIVGRALYEGRFSVSEAIAAIS
jgi:phosphoribosylformimino-5-aminoimidazole carboxamide ribotide isomerase